MAVHDPRVSLVASRLREMRARTLSILAPFSEADYAALHAPFVGPVAWDTPHIARFEELWLVHRAGPNRAAYADVDEGLDPTYDAVRHPKPERASLDLPSREKAVADLVRVRAETLRALATVDFGRSDPLLSDGFVHEMVLGHEAQHQETILVTASVAPEGRYAPGFRRPKPPATAKVAGMARVAGGPFSMGTSRRAGTYDNEWPEHVVDVPAFSIARGLVTNGEYLRFVDSDGYAREDLWSEEGWLMRTLKAWEHPLSWRKDGAGGWTVREFDRVRPLPVDEPVFQVSFYEAEAYAAFVGARLPTEVEWEKAATFDPKTGAKRAHPWGNEPWTAERANLDQFLFGPAPVGSYPAGQSPLGIHQLLGDVWEWTTTEFSAYPGFEAFPYEGYSAPFFDRGYNVLRGGSFATRPNVARGTFRNWHQPDHQQEFAGIRLARTEASA